MRAFLLVEFAAEFQSDARYHKVKREHTRNKAILAFHNKSTLEINTQMNESIHEDRVPLSHYL